MSLDLKRLTDACARVAAPTYEPGQEGSFRPFRRDEHIYYTHKIKSALSGKETTTLEDVFRLFAYPDPDGLVTAAYVMREYLPQNLAPTSHDSLKVEASEIKVYPGDLVVNGDIENGGIVLVLGKLTVSGTYWDLDVGCQIVVLGETWIKRANIYGGARIANNLAIEQILWGIDHSNSIYVSGVVKSPLVAMDDKVLRSTAAEIKVFVGDENQLESGQCDIEVSTTDAEELADLFVDELLLPTEDSEVQDDEEEEREEYEDEDEDIGHDCGLDIDKVFEFLEMGQEIWKKD